MPTYKVTAPDGRSVKLTGDSPPTEQELEEVFASLGPSALVAAAAPPAERSGTDMLRDAATGLGKSVYNTVAGLNRVFAGPDLKGGPIGVAPPTPAPLPVRPEEQTAYTIGNMAQFLLPGGAVKGVPGMLAQGAKSAGLAAAQGETGGGVALAGGLGAAGPLTASLAGKLGPALREGAERQMARVLGPTTKENKAITEKVVPELLERGVTAATRKSFLSKASAKLAKTGFDLEKALDKVPIGKRVETGPILKHLEDAKKAFVVDGVVLDAEAVARFDTLQKTIAEYGPDVSFYSLRRVRQIYDKVVAQARGFHGKTLAEGSTVEAKRELANAIRGELAKAAPDVAKINKEYSFWANVEKVLGDTVERTQSQSKPLGEQLIRAGAVAGGLGSVGAAGGAEAATAAFAIGALNKAVRSTAWNTWSSVNKARVADLMARGRFDEAVSLLSRVTAGATAQGPKE